MMSRQRGITLIESLIAMVVMALGILGIVGVQMRTLTDTQAGVRRAQAIRLIDDLGERLQNNPDALNNLETYTTSPGAGTDCTATACTPPQLAAFDIRQWRLNVAAALPAGSATVFIPQGGARQLGVMVGWNENRYNASGTTEQTKALNAPLTVTGTNAAGVTMNCPGSQNCHIQYLQPTQRCAPWTVGGAGLYCAN
ncbi:type IV pilus modification protein PilV [Pantoea sp. 18069]|uniref:type IV pilus modification protein PilV n=1 Tax=Pantoea sp. 18069 TaxID=2681415 RepID=UPI00190F107A|nr:type IV pilus modification protein PilV [Pantoea sp. 18069]